MTESRAPDPDDPFAFTPVASASRRHDGWTPERQRDFIAQLARVGLIAAAARAVGMSPKSAYALRNRAGDDSDFVRAWNAALAEGRAQARSHVIDRALNGVTSPVFYRGRQVGERRRFNDSLLIAALRATDERYRPPPRGNASSARDPKAP